jgi:hypothetical protein
MKLVKVFETKDGKLFNDREVAEKHELMVNIRGFLQSNGKGGNLTATDVATFLAQRQDEVYEVIAKYRRTLAGIKSNRAK